MQAVSQIVDGVPALVGTSTIVALPNRRSVLYPLKAKQAKQGGRARG